MESEDAIKIDDMNENDNTQMAEHIQEMKCPACGAPIALDESADAVICSYCGTKVFVDDDIYRYHRMLKVQTEAKHREAKAQLELDKEKEVLEIQRKITNAFSEKPIETVSVLLCTIWLFTEIISGHFGFAHIAIEVAVVLWAAGAKKRPLLFTNLGTYLKNNKIQAVVFLVSAMIMLFCFLNGGVGLFLISLVGLIWSIKSGQKTDTDEGGENGVKRVYIRSNAVNYNGRPYTEVMEELSACGFTDIVAIKKRDLVKGWLAKAGNVESISINGNKSFSEGQEYRADAKVVIEYHAFK